MKILRHCGNFVKALFCFFLVFVSGTISAQNKKINNRTNSVLIMADDLGYADLAFMRSDLYETPNVDLFAGEAMYFNHSYSAHPTCQPSRLAMQTGKGSRYEGGCRVLLFIKWPGVTIEGSTSDERVIGIDHYPTILTMGNRETGNTTGMWMELI